ncbi:MAG: RNA-splicing ligase RtcB [Bacteroidetes bacterium 4572_117]|nr:MAG: RNA-splicing ligase RtcB [Bacteroidetes bacterium 4572_117]
MSTEKTPIKLWLDDIEEGALEQAKNLANLPFTYKHVAIMPDSHYGYGMPIGAVLATNAVVIPNAVGVDIGCGMCAMKTNIKELDTNQLKSILGTARKLIPVGKNSHNNAQDETLMPINHTNLFVVGSNYKKATKQIGTLGGGNHFIEIQKGSDGFIWVMIHSGSRNLGYKVASHYNELAKKLNQRYYSTVDPKMGLAFLPIETDAAKQYLDEMQYCIDFALANRMLMMNRVIDAFTKNIGEFNHDEIINESHNFAAWENHFGENVIVHRKGATRAFEGELGMIPGSQGTKSYIVRGLGNPQSFKSCSHGAGRKMSRTKAQNELNLKYEIKLLSDQGIIHSIRHKKDLDEASSAYKDIAIVMENQDDLAEIVVELQPLAVLKG